MDYYYKTLKEEHKKIGGKKDAFDPAISKHTNNQTSKHSNKKGKIKTKKKQ